MSSYRTTPAFARHDTQPDVMRGTNLIVLQAWDSHGKRHLIAYWFSARGLTVRWAEKFAEWIDEMRSAHRD